MKQVPKPLLRLGNLSDKNVKSDVYDKEVISKLLKLPYKNFITTNIAKKKYCESEIIYILYFYPER